MLPSELAFLQALVWSLPAGPTLVEVGSWKGRSTTAICEALEVHGGRLIAVDTFQGDPSTGIADVQREFHTNTARFARMIDVIVGDSVDAAREVADGSVDCVFLDARHTYEAVVLDIGTWASKLREGGIMCGHDYHHPPVGRAVRHHYGRVPVWCSIWYTTRRPGRHPVLRAKTRLSRLLRPHQNFYEDCSPPPSGGISRP